MAFNPDKYFIEDWLQIEETNLLQKICNIIDTEGRLVGQYKTRLVIVPVGVAIPHGASKGRPSIIQAPSLFRSFTYDDDGNQVASLPSMREWTQACEDAAQGANPDPVDPIGVPFGMNIAYSECVKVSDSIPYNIETSVGIYTVPVGEQNYLRYTHVSSCNRGIYKLYIDGVLAMTKYTSWTQYNETFDFSTANGGKLLVAGQDLELKVINISMSLEEFEGVFVIVRKAV
jgi:hypothetical protein